MDCTDEILQEEQGESSLLVEESQCSMTIYVLCIKLIQQLDMPVFIKPL